MEIERKFLVKSDPVGTVLSVDSIKQGYITTGEEELRLRIKNDEFFFTIKRGFGIQREEHEFKISWQTFQALSVAVKKYLSKERHKIYLGGGLIAELDVYFGLPTDLRTVEVEFSTLDEALCFTPPDWFGEEVTGNKEYSNASLIELLSDS